MHDDVTSTWHRRQIQMNCNWNQSRRPQCVCRIFPCWWCRNHYQSCRSYHDHCMKFNDSKGGMMKWNSSFHSSFHSSFPPTQVDCKLECILDDIEFNAKPWHFKCLLRKTDLVREPVAEVKENYCKMIYLASSLASWTTEIKQRLQATPERKSYIS